MNKEIDTEESPVTQKFGNVAPVRLALSAEVRHRSVNSLNRLLAHSLALRDLYKKSHWQTSGATFYELHRMFDSHFEAQSRIGDLLAERVQMLGGVSLATARDVVSESRIARAPRGREEPAAQLLRLANGHEVILADARPLARAATEIGDDGTSDLIVSEVVRTNELQSWFVGEHLTGMHIEGQT
jgi:starvation-inducible DNA-binding protein